MTSSSSSSNLQASTSRNTLAPSTSTTSRPPSVAPPVIRRPTQNAILVSPRQKGNPVLELIRGVAWEYADIPADYQVGSTTGVLYLSIRYHLLHPEYVASRIESLGQGYGLRVLLVSCDAKDFEGPIRELSKICVMANFTMIVGWSTSELSRYLSLLKSFETRPPDLLKPSLDPNDHMGLMNEVLTNGARGVNKSDVKGLVGGFGSFKRIVQASESELLSVPGLGEKKVKRLRECFSEPLVITNKRPRAEERGMEGNELN